MGGALCVCVCVCVCVCCLVSGEMWKVVRSLWFLSRRIVGDFESSPASRQDATAAAPAAPDAQRRVDTPEPGARFFEDGEAPYRSVDGAVTEQFATPYPLQADS